MINLENTALKRIKTGIKGLDYLLRGGIPKKTNVLIIGAPGAGKTTLARQIIYTSLKNNLKVVYITTAEPPSNIKEQMNLMKWNIEEYKNQIKFIDGYSWRISINQREKEEYQLSNINRLNELEQLFKKAVDNMHINSNGVILFDSLSDLLLHTEEKSVFKLVQLITGEIKSINSNGIFLIESGIHDEKQVSTINYIMDGTIEMRISEDKRQIRIKRMADTIHPLQWIDFRISEGVEIKIEEFFK